jgi:metallo-beta-lactamase class B
MPMTLLLAALLAQADPTSRSWNQPVEPFRVIGNVHYVGANEITSFLITTPEGHILLDGGFVETAPQILANIRKLGFRPEDVKVLLNSQAHYDHAGGFAELKRATGASLQVMEGDAEQVARGGRGDFAFGDKFLFPPVKPDRVLHRGDGVFLGGTSMKAVLTAGHTRGCTTWTMTATEGARRYSVVFVCSTTAPGYDLAHNTAYPNIINDFRESFRTLAALPCDVFLASHGSFFHLREKTERFRRGDSLAFVDPEGYRKFVSGTRDEFEAQVRAQLAGVSATCGHQRASGADRSH